jgi:hypothetical protein
MVPFLAGLEALPLAFVWGRAHTFPPLLRGLAFFAIGSVLAAITILNMTGYFGDFPDSDAGKYTFGQEYTDAIQAVNKLPGNPYVYLYSNRWGINYETRLYLAPNWRGEDRSEEYSTDKTVTYQTDRKQDVVYVFLGKYLDGINEAARLYPGGTRYEKKFGNDVPEYRLYHLPGLKPGETPAAPLPTFAPTPTPTPRAGGDVRDRTRQSDLQRLQQILEQYKTKHGTYPSNNGGIQTLCVYKKDDVGCKLEEIQKPLPVDPLPPPTDNGYFYSSDGKTYEIYSLRESNVLPPCPDHPEHLARLPGILCVKGP